MIYDLQKANIWKRISAYLCDMILIGIVAVGMAFLLSMVLGYDTYTERMDASYAEYEERFGVSFDISEQDFAALSDAEKAAYEEAWRALVSDEEFSRNYSMAISLTVVILTFGILFAYLLLEFFVPLLLKNGQTLGKKVFGIGVMRADGVKLTAPLLFVRSVLGKYTVETMVPVMIIVMILLGALGIFGTVLLAALTVAQMALLFGTQTRAQIHDKLAGTVVIDMASQMIFDSPEALMAYKNRLHAEKAEKAEY